MSKHFILAGAALVALSACQRDAEPANNVDDTMVEANGMAEDLTVDTTPISLSDADKSFLEEAIKGDIGEVQIGQLAANRGQSDAVKTFGQTLATDHGLHRGKLLAMAQRAGMTQPTEPTNEAAKNYAQLQAASPNQFDAVFKGMMVEDHQKDIEKYQKQAAGTGPVAEMAKETVPILQRHLETAKSL